MDDDLKRLEETLRQANENLMRLLRELFGSEDDPRALELLRLTSQKEAAEDALVTHLLDTIPLDEVEPIPPPAKPEPAPRLSDRFVH